MGPAQVGIEECPETIPESLAAFRKVGLLGFDAVLGPQSFNAAIPDSADVVIHG
jgi:hypothetical protein